jgi:hypothetical protein
MKLILTTAMLSLGSALAVAQEVKQRVMGSELQIGYSRETFKMRDLQASPMLYVANLNGLQVGYTRQTVKNQWHVEWQVGLGDLIAPGLGIRGIKFTPEQEQPLWLVPTLYRGGLTLEYRRLIGQSQNQTSWLGVGLQDQIGYADGLALSTWAFNSVALRLQYQTRLQVGKRHTLVIDAALPALTAVSRMPYSNVVSEPNSSEVATFLRGTQLATLNRFISPELDLHYRFKLSRRVSFDAGYQYSWMRYPEPRQIRTTDHAFKASVIYQFQQQSR